MHKLEKKLFDLGIVDNTLKSVEIDNWFDNTKLSFDSGEISGIVTIEFVNCFEITLKHDRTYSKRIREDGERDYKYFVQDIEVNEVNGFYEFKISGWPLEGEIACKDILIHTERQELTT